MPKEIWDSQVQKSDYLGRNGQRNMWHRNQKEHWNSEKYLSEDDQHIKKDESFLGNEEG